MNLDRLQQVRQTLVSLPQSVSELQESYQAVPLAGSPAAKEHSSFPGEETVSTLYSQVGLFLTSIADHMSALEKVLTEPVMTVAPWTVGRSIL